MNEHPTGPPSDSPRVLRRLQGPRASWRPMRASADFEAAFARAERAGGANGDRVERGADRSPDGDEINPDWSADGQLILFNTFEMGYRYSRIFVTGAGSP